MHVNWYEKLIGAIGLVSDLYSGSVSALSYLA